MVVSLGAELIYIGLDFSVEVFTILKYCSRRKGIMAFDAYIIPFLRLLKLALIFPIYLFRDE